MGVDGASAPTLLFRPAADRGRGLSRPFGASDLAPPTQAQTVVPCNWRLTPSDLRGRAVGARRVDGVHVPAAFQRGVPAELAATAGPEADGGRRDADPGVARHPGHSLAETVAGPVGISVGDARVEEAAGALLVFAVTLSRAAGGALTRDYDTANGSAQAGADYTAVSDTLTFRAGESSRTIEVAVNDDDHDEGEETLTLTLSNPSGPLTSSSAQKVLDFQCE